jgi:hypothetical protein
MIIDFRWLVWTVSPTAQTRLERFADVLHTRQTGTTERAKPITLYFMEVRK